MAQSATKATFVADLQAAVNQLLSAKNSLADLVNCYFKNAFNAGAANQIVDGDVSAYNLTAAKVANGITMSQQLANFFANAGVTTGDYESTAQQLRTS
jgi:hypothetical protein